MWLHIEYKCDKKRVDVPLTFLKDYEVIEEELKKKLIRDKYYVFWSPKDNETPESVIQREGRILLVDRVVKKSGTKVNEIVPGYYEATLITHANTLEDLLALVNKPETRKPKRANTHICDPNDEIPVKKRIKNKQNRELTERARQVNLTLNSVDKSEACDQQSAHVNKSSSEVNEPAKPLLRKNNRPKNYRQIVADSDEESVLDSDSDPEVVPASKLSDANNVIKEKNEKLRQLKMQNKILCDELKDVRDEKDKKERELKSATEAFDKYRSECEELKSKVNNLLELNMKWQDKELSRSVKHHSSSSSRRHSSSHKSGRKDDSTAVKKELFSREAGRNAEALNGEGRASKKAADHSSNKVSFEETLLDGFGMLEGINCDFFEEITAISEPEKNTAGHDLDTAYQSPSKTVEMPSTGSQLNDDNNVGKETELTVETHNEPKVKAKETASQPNQQVPSHQSSNMPSTSNSKTSKNTASRGGIKIEERDFTLKAPDGVPQISFQTFLQVASIVKMGEEGDSQFVKHLCDQLWTKDEMAVRSVTGKACVSIEDAVAKKECTPSKKRYLTDLLRLKIDHEIVQVDDTKRKQRSSEPKIKAILRSKLKTVASSKSAA